MNRRSLRHLAVSDVQEAIILMIIDWIDFGKVSAERDENLSNYFFENGVLQSVIDNRHCFLVLGRKGAGKTAVFQHFNDNPAKFIGSNDVAINLSLQDYSWNVHSLLSTQGKAPSLAYIQSWKYLIYLLSIKELVSRGSKNKNLKLANWVIEKIYNSPSPTLGQVIGQKLLQLSKLKFPSAGFDLQDFNFDSLSVDGGEVSFSDIKQDGGLQVALNHSIERLTDIFEDALGETLREGAKVFITFDRIDEAWDSESFEISQKIISGLIGASEYINKKFDGYLRPIVFLREDIFETIDINDKNKLRSDCGKLLAGDPQKPVAFGRL